MQELRLAGIRCELYHESSKFDKQFKYAEKKNVPLVVIIGSKEIDEKTSIIKDLKTGLQTEAGQSDMADQIRKLLENNK